MRTWSPALLVLAACGGAAPAPAPVPDKPIVVTTLPAPPAPPPPAGPRRGDDVDEIHGVKVADPYRWLEDATAPEVQAWMAKQDAATRARLAAVPTRAALKGRLEELWYYDLVGAPEHRAGRYFWTQRHKDKEKRVAYWKQGEAGAPQVMFDPNTWSDDGSLALGGWEASWDGRLVAYKVRKNNSDEATLHIRDVATGKDLDDVIEGAKYAWASWLPDSSGFYYTWVPPISPEVTVELRPGKAELRFHRIGTPPASDAVVYPATGDPRIFINGGVSRDGRWLIASLSRGWSSNDIYLQDRRAARPAWVPLVTGTDHNYAVTAWKDTLYVTTDEGAPRYRVMAVDPRRPARKHWKEIVAQADATLEHTKIIGNRLVLSYMRNATTAIEIRRLDGRLVREVALPGLGSAGLYGRADEDTAFLSYGDFVTPARILRTSIASGKTAEWSRVTLPIDPSFIESEQVWYPSKDGTQVSMFIVHKKGLKLNGDNPTILYGYGGFNVSITPTFSASMFQWLNAGGVYAVANIRGGGEYGNNWHQGGKLENKQNVFDDFAAAGEWLAANKYTRAERLAIRGGSNGGLLTGTMVTQRPDLFAAALVYVPLLDMVRFQDFLMAKYWVPEYGSATDPEQFKYILKYSPYQNIKAGTKYPAVLVTAGENDARVHPMHARKYAAALRAATASDPMEKPILLWVDREAGHGQGKPLNLRIREVADERIFLMRQLGMLAYDGTK